MIELRWLTRERTYTDEEWRAYCTWIADPTPPKHIDRVLQYRTLGPSARYYSQDGELVEERRWTEWQDVPEESTLKPRGV